VAVKARYVVGGVVIVLFTLWGAFAFFKTTIRYVSIEQARHSRTTVQVMGNVDFGSVAYDTEQLRLEFVIYDAEADDAATAARMPVVYYGVVPGNFDQASAVVLKGKGDGSVFVAEQMLVKCPSKYQGDDADDYQDMRRHGDSAGQAGA